MYSKNQITWIENYINRRLKTNINLNFKNNNFILSTQNKKNKIIFNNLNYNFLSNSNIEYQILDLKKENITYLDSSIPAPGFIGNPEEFIYIENEDIYISYDILGFFYWSLNRIEEVYASSDSFDIHNRFIGKKSYAYKHNYHERPLIDEWFIFLQAIIFKILKIASGNKKTFKIIATSDIDMPFITSIRFFPFIKSLFGDIFIRKNIFEPLRRFFQFIISLLTNGLIDPYKKNLLWMLEMSVKTQLQMELFFIPIHTSLIYDFNYDLNKKKYFKLLKKISNKNAVIGIHPGYETSKNNKLLIESARIFNAILKRLQKYDYNLIARQHYLRCEYPNILRDYEDIGIKDDFSMGYADICGFRSSTSHTYKMFDHLNDREINVTVHPLVIMDTTLFDKSYMSYKKNQEAIRYIKKIKNNVFKVNGDFTFLFHNSNLHTQFDKDFFCELISNIE